MHKEEFFCVTHLSLNRLLELLEGSHPCNRVDEICERGTLCAQSAHSRADRIFPGCATWNISICAMKGEVGLVQFSNQVSIIPEDLSAFFHIRFCFINFALSE